MEALILSYSFTGRAGVESPSSVKGSWSPISQLMWAHVLIFCPSHERCNPGTRFCQHKDIQTCREFLWVYLSQANDICQGTRSQMLQNSFAASFMHLKLWDIRKMTWRWEKARRVLKSRLCALLRVVRAYFTCVLTQMHRHNWQGLFKAKINLLLKKLCAWDVIRHHEATIRCPVRKFWSDHTVRLRYVESFSSVHSCLCPESSRAIMAPELI